jgi:transposase-like protein
MTYQDDFTLPTELLEQVTEQGLDYLPELIRIVVNTAMQAERQKYIGVGPYERSAERQGQRNGFKPKTVRTRIAPITFDIPQVREGGFYPQALEKGLRSERALMIALAEMYVQGVSTRKVAAITEKLCGSEISSTQVSRAATLLNEVLEPWRNRPLGTVIYLYLDALYEKVRVDGQVRDVAVLIASGVKPDGKRLILGVSVSLGEQEQHWRDFLQSLVERGLNGVELIISDAHVGLQAARKAVFSGILWQLHPERSRRGCQFHMQQNASQYVPRQSMKREVAADIRAIFNAPDRDQAEAQLRKTVGKYAQSASRLADWLEGNIPEGLTVFSFPEDHRRRIRTVNSLERVCLEIRRRTRVARIFPNEDSCLRLVSAVLMERSETWETGKIYLSFERY